MLILWFQTVVSAEPNVTLRMITVMSHDPPRPKTIHP